jgi:predicted DNA-binding transcriptional regulator AlpA
MTTIYTNTERRSGYQLESLGEIPDSDLVHFARLVGKLFADAKLQKFGLVLMTFIKQELKRRQSNGAIEATMPAIPCDLFSDSELVEFAAVTDLLREFSTLSQQERALATDIHRKLQLAIGVRLQVDRSGSRLMNKQEVADLLAINDEQVMRLVKADKLPKPFRLGAKTLRWNSQEVYQAIRDL